MRTFTFSVRWAKIAYNLMGDEEYQRICEVKPDSGERLPAGRAAEPGELQALVKVCQADPGAAGARDAAMLAVLYIGGVRRAELAGLDVADYTPDPSALKVRAGKGNKDRVVPLIGSAAAALDDWLALRGRLPGPLFVPVNRGDRIRTARLASHAIYKILRKRLAQAGVEDLRPHDFRRTFVVICTSCGHPNVIDRQRAKAEGIVKADILELDREPL